MFSHNLKTLRKQKGMSQEGLAAQLHVVRQTVSKWEKGLSVPDATMLQELAEILEVSVAALLGENIPETEDKNALAEELARISEELAIKNRRSRRIWKIVAIVLLAGLAIQLLLVVFGAVTFTHISEPTVTTVPMF